MRTSRPRPSARSQRSALKPQAATSASPRRSEPQLHGARSPRSRPADTSGAPVDCGRPTTSLASVQAACQPLPHRRTAGGSLQRVQPPHTHPSLLTVEEPPLPSSSPLLVSGPAGKDTEILKDFSGAPKHPRA